MNNRRLVLLAGVVLVLATLAVYQRSLEAPFLFDDNPAVVDNPTIRHLWPLGQVLSPPSDGSGVTGRPAVNLSLAVNYALGGLEVRGYHVMNLLLHAFAALTLWGVLRRTLRFPCRSLLAGDGIKQPTTESPASRLLQKDAELMAFTCALLWAVHPLLTESVVCIVQRTEVLAGLFYLLTFYCFIRATTTTPAGRGWQVLAVAACLLGMASKEIVATAPLLVLLYDRTFVAGSFREAWRRRKFFHGALAATWLPLAWLMAHSLKRGGTVGFGLGMNSWDYLLTQCEALTIYLKLSLWPHPLVVDYGLVLVRGYWEVWWQGLLIVALLLATGIALRRKPVLGFLGAWFFVILAPSSSFVPLTTQTIAEHRMYLPLAALIVLAAGGAGAWLGRRALAGLLALALVAGGLTVRRTAVYQTEMSLWQDTVAHYPGSARAQSSLGTAYYHQGDLPEAVRRYKISLQINPRIAQTHYNLGLTLDALHRNEAAAASYEEAVKCYEEAVRILPYFAPAHAELGGMLFKLGRFKEAETHLRTALTYLPDLAEAHSSLGQVLAQEGRIPEALAAFERTVQLKPDLADGHYNYAVQLSALGRTADAMAHYREAVRLDRTHALARLNLGILLAQGGQSEEALSQLREAVRLRPDLAETHANLGLALAVAGRPAEALGCYEQALRLRPDYALAHYNLGNALVQLQRWDEARRHFAEALRLEPGMQDAREMLEKLKAVSSDR